MRGDDEISAFVLPFAQVSPYLFGYAMNAGMVLRACRLPGWQVGRPLWLHSVTNDAVPFGDDWREHSVQRRS
ncbi:hypothetical protein GN958_ATG04852 [Phytophthora infestans]|uniref:Uncharacterized protein n=1 Tax=Phytophthora infestans TaxID=4787 RepID=A0A8S9V032_PHYIN|nr:hypothetical protein GN958_ATG04852 [Phytophthora infestans]